MIYTYIAAAVRHGMFVYRQENLFPTPAYSAFHFFILQKIIISYSYIIVKRRKRIPDILPKLSRSTSLPPGTMLYSIGKSSGKH